MVLVFAAYRVKIVSENLKSMVSVLEVVIFKGDITLDNQLQSNEFDPEGENTLF